MKLPRWLRWRSSQELDEEIAAHLDFETQAGTERGLSPEEAKYAARRTLGNIALLKERAREGDPLCWLESIAKDLRYALRGLRRNPGFTAAAVLSLALGIGVNCAIFSFADGLLLRPLDVRDPGEIVQVHSTSPRFDSGSFTYREYATYRDQTRTLSGLIAESPQYFAVETGDGEQTRIVFGHFVSGNCFAMFGVKPVLGRSFLPEEDSAAAKDIVAVLSAQGWQSRFHSDPHVVGQRIKVNSQPVTIVGVLPGQFIGTNYFLRSEIYLPLAAGARLLTSRKVLPTDNPAYANLNLYGRLKPGASIQSAQAEFTVLAKQIQSSFPEVERQRAATVLPDITARVQQDQDDLRLIYVLMGIAAIVLLVGCVNVANLLLGRASARVKEITIRQSVGASRGRLMAQLLTESVVLAGLGACGGLLFAWWAIHLLTSIQISPDFASSFPARLDARVLWCALSAAAAAVLLAGLWPAIRATRVDLISAAKGAARGRTGSAGGRQTLVAIQTALATMLLISAALFIESFVRTSRANPGFRVNDVLVVSFDPALGGYSNARAQSFYREVEDRVSQLPGVSSAALGSHLPMGTNSQFSPIAPEGGDDNSQISAMFSRVSANYFSTMAVPILEGRAFDGGDQEGSPGVVIVNQALAERFWPKGDAVGRRIRWLGDGGPKARMLEVVGIAGNGKYQVSIDKYEPYFYVAARQHPSVQMTLFLHTAGDPAAMTAAIREAVKAVAADVPVYGAHTMQEIFAGHGLLPARLMAELVGAMGAIGLTLGVLGLYAVIAFAVTRRTREIGIRMALGSTAVAVLRGVLASGVKVTLAGVAIGLGGAFALTRYFAEFLDRISPHDLMAFAGVPLILLAAALAACWVPARRAARIDPAITLRYE